MGSSPRAPGEGCLSSARVRSGEPRAGGIACRHGIRHARRGPRLEATISALFDSADRGGTAAADALFTALYEELRRLADRQLARYGAGGALATTSVLHEAYLDIAAREGLHFPDRPRFFGYAARVMRGLI